MDPSDSDVIILEDIIDSSKADSQTTIKPGAVEKKQGKDPSRSSSNGDEEEDIDEVPDFDDADLEVLDCWEDDVEEQDHIRHGGEIHTLKEGNVPLTSSLPERPGFEPKDESHRVSLPERHDKRKSSCESDATILFEDLTHLDDSKTAEYYNSSNSGKLHDVEKSNQKDQRHSIQKHISSKESKSSRKENSKKKFDHSFEKMSEEKRFKLHADTTEQKVENFLKVMALEHPRMFSLQDESEKSVSLDSVSSASSKNVNQGILPSSSINLSDLPPGVDLEQVAQDTSTSSLLASAVKANAILMESACDPSGNTIAGESSTIPGLMDPSQKVTKRQVSDSLDSSLARGSKYQTRVHSRTDTSKRKEKRSRSPHAKEHSSRSSRSSPPHKIRITSPARSFTLSPSPSPRSKRSRSPLLCVRPTLSAIVANFTQDVVKPTLPSTLVTNFAHNAHKYVSRSSQHRTPSTERNRYRRTPVRESTMLRALSRSLSRDRIERHSRSKDRSYTRHTSRSRRYYSSKEDRVRRYRKSSSRSWSPDHRPRSWSSSRSRSTSPSHHRYRRRNTPLRDEIKSKRPNTSRSTSRSRSPWKPTAGTSSAEWHSNYHHINGMPHVDEEVKLEHDMARFIATNIAATGLLPNSGMAVGGWFKPGNKPSNVVEVRTEPLLDHGMPLPPPPPDISELMTADEIKETGSLGETSPVDQNISLSSLLESAMSGSRGSPSQAILDRCQDAIMKLHDGSIKPGRFAVICSIGIPHVDPPYSFQPWQSALNRSVANKIHFSFSKPPDQPIYWDSPTSKPQPHKSSSPTHKQERAAPLHHPSPSSFVPCVPVSSTDLDRSALLEKITYLTRELHDVRQILDRKNVEKKDACVQTFSYNFCQSCGDRNDFSMSFEQRPPGIHTPKPAHASQLMPLSQSVPAPQPFTASLPVSEPLPLPASDMNQHSNPSYQSASRSSPYEISGNSTSLISSNHPAMISNPSMNWQSSIQSSSSMKSLSCPEGQSFKNQCVPRLNTDQQISALSKDSGQPSRKSIAPTTKTMPPLLAGPRQDPPVKSVAPAMVPALKPVPILKPVSSVKPVPPAPAKNLKPQQPLTPNDFNVIKYQMIGDEHLFDLTSYLRSVGTQVKFDPNLCSPGLNVERLLKGLMRARLDRQIVLMIGFYDGTYTPQILNKYQQLVGFLRKRCHHLVLIEPPPIPKWGLCKKHWNSFSKLAANYLPPRSENISIVYSHSLLLESDQTPNVSMFVNSERLNQNGLQLIADELQRVILDAKKKKFG